MDGGGRQKPKQSPKLSSMKAGEEDVGSVLPGVRHLGRSEESEMFLLKRLALEFSRSLKRNKIECLFFQKTKSRPDLRKVCWKIFSPRKFGPEGQRICYRTTELGDFMVSKRQKLASILPSTLSWCTFFLLMKGAHYIWRIGMGGKCCSTNAILSLVLVN